MFGLLVVAVGFLSAYAQVDYSTATLKGTIYDPQGAVIANASVTVTNPSTGFTKTVKVNSDGSYVIPVLQPGVYEISVEAQGFQKEVAKTFTLAVGTISVFDGHLKVGAASEIVEVTGDTAPVIQITQTQQADYINQIAEQNIPSVGRDYSQTIQLLPGMTNAAAIHSSGAQRNIGAFAVNNFTTAGGNGRGGLVTIDGGENDYGSGASRTTHISPDAIQELQVNRNSFTAEFGFTLAEHVNVVTKSGGNQLHGTAFALFRDQVTDAKPFFQVSNNHSMDQDYHIGGSIGGALVKDKTFFFLNTEGYRTTFESLKNFNTGFLTGPSAAQQAYIQKVAASNPAVAALMTGVLTPANIPAVQQLVAGQSGFVPGDQKWLDSVARLDWLPNEANTLTFRFLHEREDAPLNLGGGAGGYGAGVGPTISSSYATRDTIRDYELLTTWSHVFSPTLLNTLRVQLVPEDVIDLTWNNGHGGPTTPFQAFTDGFGTFGPLLGAEVFSHQRRYQFEDSVTWTLGKHTFKFGESFRPVKYTYFDNLYAHSQVAYVPGILSIFTPFAANPAVVTAAVTAAGAPPPTTSLTSLQSFSFGLPTQFRTSTGNNVLIANWAYYGGVYFQDSWKMTSRLTVDAGIRFDADQESFPNQSPNYYASPRVGFAYDIFGDHKTVLRAGGGIFVAPAQFQNSYYSNLYNPTGSIGFAQAVETIGTPNYFALLGVLKAKGNLPVLKPVTAADYAAAGIPIAQGQANGIGIINPISGYKNNYGIQGSLSIQRELGKNMSLEVGYNVQHTIHLQDPLEVGFINSGKSDPLLGPILTPNPANNPLIGVGPTAQPKFETLTSYCACGGAIYHAGTVSLTRRFANHLQFQTNYTYSKAIDDVLDFSSFTSTYFPTSPRKDRAVSAFNISHIFTTSAVYTTPFSYNSGSFWTRALADISLSPIVSMHSGTPFELFDSPPTGAAGNGLVQEALNQARPFNAPRNSGILPWNYRWDMRFNKDIRLSKSNEAIRLGLSVTAANLLNRTNFTGVNGLFPIGSVAQALDPLNTLPNGGNLLNGPFNLHGVKSLDFKSGFLPGQVPLAFNSADIARQIQLGLRLSF
jgi:hypothetical protein